MTTRTVAQITDATNERVGPFAIKNVLPTRQIKQVDPFLLIHHLPKHDLKPGDEARIPPHPHAGFEVVTYLLEGEFFHRDSKGNDQVATGGDINWMTSGSGIVHSEGPTENFLKTGGPVQLLQIWINLPLEKKMMDASFRHYKGNNLPVEENGDAWLKVLMGTYKETASPVATQTALFAYHIKLKAGKLFTLPVDNSYTAALYIMHGKVKVLNYEAAAGYLVDFSIDGDQLAFTATEDTELLAFGGLPIKEKVVSYGPFVMNSFEQVQKAMEDYETGKMGVLDY